MGLGNDPRFDYSTYERNIFATRKELTGLSEIILDTKLGWASVIINTIRITSLLMLFRIRQAMLEEEQILDKQIYERRRSDSNESDIDEDDQDGKPKQGLV